MSSLTKVVKSFGVVYDKPKEKPSKLSQPDFGSNPVIKSAVIKGGFSLYNTAEPTTQQSLLDEMNRLKVDIAQAKAEHRVMSRELDGLKADIELAKSFLVEEGGDVQSKQNQLTKLKEEAQLQADEIVAKAFSKGRDMEEEAKNEGYLQGFNKGYEEAAEEFKAHNQPKAKLLEDIIIRLKTYSEEQIEQNESDLISLCLSIANKIICREISLNPDAIADMLYETIDSNKREDFVKITISPSLLPIETEASEEIRKIITSMGANVTIQLDADLNDGDCIVETPKGFTDISIATQLNNIEENLRAT